MNSRSGVLSCALFLLLLFLIDGHDSVFCAGQQVRSDRASPISSPRLLALQRRLQREDRAALTKFWEEVKRDGTPLVETIKGDKQDVLVTFLWRGAEETRNVVIFLQSGGANPADNRMARLADSDVWYRSYTFRRDARFTYTLSPNDDLTPLDQPNLDWQKRFAGVRPDPLNPLRHPTDPSQPNVLSVVELPGATAQPWVKQNPVAPRGKVDEQTIKSATLNNERRLWVYTPASYQRGGNPLPLLILFDGWSYINLVPTPTILDNLIASRRIPPLVAVLVDNADASARDRELPCHKPFADFLATELIPRLREKYRVTTDPARTVIAGSSYGGLASTCAAFWYPRLFGNVLAQSSSYGWKPDDDPQYEWVRRQFMSESKLPLRFYLTVGLLETLPKPGNTNQVEVNRRFRDGLRTKGYEVYYTEFNGAHEYVNWQGTLADALIALTGKWKP